nr:ubiquitin-like modifier-activating enzyme ATG7 [Onthophagus taurus]
MESKQIHDIVPFSSCVNPSFWHKLANLKLDVYKLDETASKVWGYYSNLNCQNKPLLEVDSTSFNSEYTGVKFSLPYHGLLINKNTIEQFKDCDKLEILAKMGQNIQETFKDDRVIEDPSLLNNFLVLSHADLKKYNFYYWFAFLAHNLIETEILNAVSISSLINENKLADLYKKYSDLSINNKTYFIIKNIDDLHVLTLKDGLKLNDLNNSEYLFAFSDPSGLKENPGWPIRNYIMFLSFHCKQLQNKRVKFVGLRLKAKGPEISCLESVIWEAFIPNCFQSLSESGKSWIGYEVNERGKMGPRLAKMKDSMSPMSLADSAVDLNLKLMKWRLLPEINLDKIKETKCLLLGAGTLGCSVARNLLGWGVRTINFVDNTTVSYSNPVRQSLYTFEDSASNKSKALAAAENLKKIFPGVNSEGYNFTIPMPGHPVGQSLLDHTKDSIEKITNLIQEHDIIFLLMDSRESRWLPTVLGRTMHKIVINAALGFDTYLIMRHGVKVLTEKKLEGVDKTSELKCVPGSQLGCYFCNDITAPGDSLKDRTLDQQCTVTRPGVANIAGALAVELAISVLQHKEGPGAPAFYTTSKSADISRENETSLGILPHSIRGFLSLFTHILPATERYNQCIACSDVVINEILEGGTDFIIKVCNDSKYLEELTGLSKMYSENLNMEEWDLSETED